MFTDKIGNEMLIGLGALQVDDSLSVGKKEFTEDE